MAEKKIFTGYTFSGGGQTKNFRLEATDNDPTNVGKGHVYFNTTAGFPKVSTVDSGTDTFATILTGDSTIPFTKITGTVDADTLDDSTKSNAVGNLTIPVRDANNQFHVGATSYYTGTDFTDFDAVTATQVANKALVDAGIAKLVNAAPTALDTLEELATALTANDGDITTITTALGNRLRIDVNDQGLSAAELTNSRTNLGLGALATLNAVGAAQITNGSVDTDELATDAVTAAKLDNSASFTMAGLTVNGATAIDGITAIKDGNRLELWNTGNGNFARIESSASGVIAFSTGAEVPAMYLNNDGKLGIGTGADVDSLLHVEGAAGTAPTITLEQAPYKHKFISNGNDLEIRCDEGDTQGKLEFYVGGGATGSGHKLVIDKYTGTAGSLATFADDVKVTGGLGVGTVETTEGALTTTGAITVGSTQAGTTNKLIGITRISRSDDSPNGTAYSNVFDDLVIGSTATTNTGITIFGTSQTGIAFGDAGSNLQGQIRFNHGSNQFEWMVDGSSYAMLLSSTGLDITGSLTASGALTTGGIVNHGGFPTVNSSTVQGLQDGACYDFDGTDDWVDLNANIIGGVTVATVSAWVKPDNVSGDKVIIGALPADSDGWYWVVAGSSLKFYDGLDNHVSTATLTAGKWHHVVSAWTGGGGGTTTGTCAFYIDGVLSNTTTVQADRQTLRGDENHVLGRFGENYSGGFFKGQIRDVKIFPSALDAGDVRKLYSGENPKKNLNVNLVTNGSFTDNSGWSGGASPGWSISGGNAVATNAPSSVNAQFYQTVTGLTAGKYYKLSFTVSSYTDGSVWAYFGTSSAGPIEYTPTLDGVGTASVVGKADDDEQFVSLQIKTAGTDLVVSEISLVEVGTLVDFNPRSAGSTLWYNQAIPALYNGTLNGVTLSAGSTDYEVGAGEDRKFNVGKFSTSVGPSAGTMRLSHYDLRGGSSDYALAQSSTGDTYINAATGKNIYFRVNNNTIARLQQDGNLGVGTTTPSAWSDIWGSSIDIGTQGAIVSRKTDTSNIGFWLTNNAYYNGANKWVRKNDGEAGRIEFGTSNTIDLQVCGTEGNADEEITWSSALRVDSSGNTKIDGNLGVEMDPDTGYSIAAFGATLWKDTMWFGSSADRGRIAWSDTLLPPGTGSTEGFGMLAGDEQILSLGANNTWDHLVISTSGHTTLSGKLILKDKPIIFDPDEHNTISPTADYLTFKSFWGFKFETKHPSLSTELFIAYDGTQNHKANRIVNSQTVNDLHRTAEPSLRFSGEDTDFVSLTRTILYEEVTFSAWIKTTSEDTDVVYRGNTPNTIVGDHTGGISHSWGVDDGYVTIEHYDGSTSGNPNYGWATPAIKSTEKVNDGKWHQVCYTLNLDTGAIQIYIDGAASVHSGNGYTLGIVSTTEFVAYDRIGGSYDGGSATNTADTFDGEIKDVRIHNRVLDADEVAAAYNGESTPHRYGNSNNTNLLSGNDTTCDGPSNWVANDATLQEGGSYNSRTAHIITSTAAGSYVAGIDGGYLAATGETTSRHWNITVDVYIPSSNSTWKGVQFDYSISNNGNTWMPTATDTWQTITHTVTENTVGSINQDTLKLYAVADNGAPASGTTSDVIGIDNIKFTRAGEVAAYTPKSIAGGGSTTGGQWFDTTSNANHGTIHEATVVNPIKLGPLEIGTENQAIFRHDHAGSNPIRLINRNGANNDYTVLDFKNKDGDSVGGYLPAGLGVKTTDANNRTGRMEFWVAAGGGLTDNYNKDSDTRLELANTGSVTATQKDSGGDLAQVTRSHNCEVTFTSGSTVKQVVVFHGLKTRFVHVTVREDETFAEVEIANRSGDWTGTGGSLESGTEPTHVTIDWASADEWASAEKKYYVAISGGHNGNDSIQSIT